MKSQHAAIISAIKQVAALLATIILRSLGHLLFLDM
jgi:hypothetical protein